MPVAVLVSKVGGLYERDELVLKKTTLDEAPDAAADHRPVRPDRLPRPERLRPRRHDADAGRRAVAGELLRASSSAASPPASVAARDCARPERCLIVGDDDGDRARSAASSRPAASTPRSSPASASTRCRRAIERRALPLDWSCDNDVHRVIVAPVTHRRRRHARARSGVAKSVGVRVSVLPRLFEVVGSSVEFDHVDGLTMLGVRRFGLTRSSHAPQARVRPRRLDADAAGRSRRSSPRSRSRSGSTRAGPIFFRQTRVGRDGKPFEIFKFRTMVADAEERKDELAHLNETERPVQDRRPTRGSRASARFLRRTALDELPQLFNVWRGEMSLVGPRPLVVDEDAQIGRPGPRAACPHARHDRPLADPRLGADPAGRDGRDRLPATCANWSLWTDIKILLRTVPYVLGRRGM